MIPITISPGATTAAVRVIVYGLLGGGPEYHGWVVLASILSGVSLVAISTGLRIIFRPSAIWAKGLAAIFAAAACAGIGLEALTQLGPERPLHYRPIEFAMLACLIWGASECSSYGGKMRKRLALRLADPLITAQFGLWGASFAMGAVASCLYLFVPLLIGVTLIDSPALVLAVQTFMVGMTLGTWVAFYPPASYRRYIHRSSE